MKFSMTISGLVLVVLTQLLGDAASEEALKSFIEVGGLIIGLAVSYWGRVRQGDINLFGVKQ